MRSPFPYPDATQTAPPFGRSLLLERNLAQMKGLYDGAIDGYMRPRTRTALELYKEDVVIAIGDYGAILYYPED